MTGERVLIVDDEPQILRFCAQTLTRLFYSVREASTGQEAMECLAADSFDLLIVDLRLPDIDGIAVLRQAREHDPGLTVVVITGYATIENALEALKSGARGFILKPFGVKELASTVEEALQQQHAEQERQRLKAQLPIAQLSQARIAEGNVRELATRLLEVVAGQVRADRAVLLLLDRERGRLSLAARIDCPVEPLDGQEPVLDSGLAAWVSGGQEAFVVQSTADPALQPVWHLLGAEPGAAAAALRLRAVKQPVGLMGLGRKPGRQAFTSRDLELGVLLGAQAATALENIQLYEQVRLSRDFVRTVLDSLHDQVIVLDKSYAITDVNVPFLRANGFAREEVIGQTCHQVTHRCVTGCPGDTQSCPAAEVWRTAQPARALHIHYSSSGETSYLDVAASPLFDALGQVSGVVEACRDVTAEWQMESSLAAIRALGQQLVLSRDEHHIAQLVVDTAQHLLDFQMCSLWMVDEEQNALVRKAGTLRGQSVDLPPFGLDAGHGIMAAVARSGESIYVPDVSRDPRYIDIGLNMRSELCVPLRVGDRVTGVLNADSPRLDAFGEPSRRLLLTLADQAALALENARLFGEIEELKGFSEGLIQNMAEGLIVQDVEGRFVYLNPAGAAMLGYAPDELTGRHWTEILPSEQHQFVAAALERRQRGESQRFEALLRRRDGSVLPVLIADQPVLRDNRVSSALSVFTDLTDVKRLQEQLIQNEKLAALGRLAASLAHEINNPLQALRSGLDLLVKRPIEETKRQRYLEVASREVERLIGIVERMLNFYRPSLDKRTLTDVNSVLEETLALAGKKLQHGRVTVVRELAPALPHVEAVADQLNQVFLNIVLNALDAMPGGGLLTLRTAWHARSREVCVSFVDTGEGIPAERIPRLCEPFFTTKAKGTGLGLAISYGIVTRHGGRIDVQSQVGRGATFLVFLPAAPAEREAWL